MIPFMLTCLMAAVVTATTPDASWDLHRAREDFMAGFYRHAFEQFSELADSDQPDIAAQAVVAMADCRIAWGDYAGARKTLQARASDDADWHRAMAQACERVGDYVAAAEHGRLALARDPEHHRARYELGRLQERLGQRDAALDIYARFNVLLSEDLRLPETAEGLHYAGLGFYRYSVLAGVPNLTYRTKYVLRELLQLACTTDRTYWPARVAIADLLMEKYNLEEALEDYRSALQLNPHSTAAHQGLAAIALEAWDFENVERRVAACLDINPHHAEAYLLRAALRLVERRYSAAIEDARRALEINPRHIEALSVLAAAQMQAGLDEESEQSRLQVYMLNPNPAILHLIAGNQLAAGRQFPEAEAELLQAAHFDPTDPAPLNSLAMMYMQWGYEDKAREMVHRALDLDAFNARTFNTERLLDDLRGFEVHHSDHFEIHYQGGPDAVLGEYAAGYLEEIYAELCEDYDTELSDKTIIEFFPDHRKFGVRIHGKPWIHTVGACTGRVIAMDAPRRDVQGNYNFANVLRHEFTHTVTLAATRNRIPHWLTEGLAVLQEDRPRSWNWKKMLAERLRHDTLFPLEDIDWGFVRPRRPDDRQVAYAQSEWMCEFLIETYGYDLINRMLELFRAGQVQREVVPEVTAMSLTEFDRAFGAWARDQAGNWGLPLEPPPDERAVRLLLRWYPGSAALHAARALHLLQQDELDEALHHAQSSLEFDDTHREARRVAARIAVAKAGQQPSAEAAESWLEQARTQYRALAEHHPEQAEAAEFLAELANRQEDVDTAAHWARRLQDLQPGNPASYRILSGLYLAENDDDQALPQLLELARHEEHDADVPRQLARIYRERGQLRAAAAWYLQAVYIDPYDVDTHRRYARLLDELDDHQQAIREYRMLTLLEPQEVAHLNELAFAHLRAGQRDQAREIARQAVARDPDTPARQLLDGTQ